MSLEQQNGLKNALIQARDAYQDAINYQGTNFREYLDEKNLFEGICYYIGLYHREFSCDFHSLLLRNDISPYKLYRHSPHGLFEYYECHTFDFEYVDVRVKEDALQPRLELLDKILKGKR